MTSKMPPGAPALTIGGKAASKAGEVVADSGVPDLDSPEDTTQASLKRIAKARAGKPGRGNSSKG